MKEKPKGPAPQTRVWTPSGARPRPTSEGGRTYSSGSSSGAQSYRPRPQEGRPSYRSGGGYRSEGPRQEGGYRGGYRPEGDRGPSRPGGRPQFERGGRRPPPHRQRMTLQERRAKKEGFGRLYMDKQFREKTPMAFVTYDGVTEGILYKRLVYDLDIVVGEEKVRINKLYIKYCYKQEHTDIIPQYLQFDEAVRAQALPALKPRKERFQIDSRQLALARKNKWPVRVTLRGGEVFQGPVDWYSAFEIKMNLGEKGSVVLFRHAAYDFQLVREPVHVARRPIVEARR